MCIYERNLSNYKEIDESIAEFVKELKRFDDCGYSNDYVGTGLACRGEYDEDYDEAEFINEDEKSFYFLTLGIRGEAYNSKEFALALGKLMNTLEKRANLKEIDRIDL